MNLGQISRNVRFDKYELNVAALLRDVDLVRLNAHAFNIGPENVETRILADCIVNFMRYLVRCVVS